MKSLNAALHSLARRRLPQYPFASPTQWIDEAYGGYGAKSWYSVCLVCGDKLTGVDWDEHGKAHLKESGLLVML